MSNVNNLEFQMYSWKTNWSLLVSGIVCFIFVPFFLLADGSIFEGLIIASIILAMGIFALWGYSHDLRKKVYEIKNEEERIEALKKDVLKYLSGYYVRPRIEGHEKDLRSNLKIVLLELAEEY